MDSAAIFSRVALGFSNVMGGPFADALLISHAEPVLDDGGSIATPATLGARSCKVQIDVASQAMRQDVGFVDGDVSFIILAATVDGAVDTDAVVQVLDGPNAGMWNVSSLQLDAMRIGWTGRGRRA